MNDFHDYIDTAPGTRFGQPCVKGTRITVGDVLGWLAGGMTVEEIIADFPQLSVEKIRACLAYAGQREQGTVKVKREVAA